MLLFGANGTFFEEHIRNSEPIKEKEQRESVNSGVNVSRMESAWRKPIRILLNGVFGSVASLGRKKCNHREV